MGLNPEQMPQDASNMGPHAGGDGRMATFALPVSLSPDEGEMRGRNRYDRRASADGVRKGKER